MKAQARQHRAHASPARCRLTLAVPDDFDFVTAVCSHGFFVLAPNSWAPGRRTLATIVTCNDDTAVPVVIRGPARGSVSVSSPVRLTEPQHAAVRAAVRRMLRLEEDLSAFHQRCLGSATHGQVAASRFGRLLRSASLFEDIVKVICTCNTGWTQTVAMIDRVVEHWGVPCSDGRLRGFPTPGRLAGVRAGVLRTRARVGYRGEFIARLARDVADGRLDLDALEGFGGSSDDLYRMLRRIHGVGDYAAAHLCMLLGRYDRLAVDTEFRRFFQQRHPRRKPTPAALRSAYDAWHPYQFLAYWFDLWQDYVRRHGHSEQWTPAGVGRHITHGR